MDEVTDVSVGGEDGGDGGGWVNLGSCRRLAESERREEKSVGRREGVVDDGCVRGFSGHVDVVDDESCEDRVWGRG